jgi:hypothetical protein
VSDVLQFLAIVCGPILAVGVAFNLRGPLGRALAARLRQDPDPSDLAAVEARLDQRLAALQQAIEVLAIEIERQGEHQRMLLARSAPLLPQPANSPVPPQRRHSTPAS